MNSYRKYFLIVVALGIAWFIFGRNQVERFRFYDFNQDKWSNATPSQRYFMAKYLVDKRTLLGKTKDQVLNLLGEADGDNVYIFYNLGPQRIIYQGILEIAFGGTPDRLVVKNARIRPD